MSQPKLLNSGRRIAARARAIAALVFFVGGASFVALRDNSRALEEVPLAVSDVALAGSVEGTNAGPRVIAYYFHITARCLTCRTIEAYAREAVERGFAGELKTGAIEWRPVNVQLPENRHFIQDYRLYTRSVVLVKVKDGREMEWRNLDKVWDLVWNKDAFVKYVQANVRAYLGGS